MNFIYLWHEIQHGIFHFDRGILYTTQQLLIRPGHTIREFLEGKRVRHFKPLAFVVVLATAYGILMHYFNTNDTSDNLSGTPFAVINFEKIYYWIAAHNVWVNLLILPFVAFGDYIAFRKQRYNYVEHLVLATYLSGIDLIISLILYPLLFTFNKNPILRTIVDTSTTAIGLIYIFWGYSQFFNKLNKLKVFLLNLLSILIMGVTILILIGIVGFTASFIAGKVQYQ